MYVLFALCAPAVGAPEALTHQGRLLDATGVPLSGSHDVEISLYSSAAAATPLWTEAQTVAFDNGYFSVLLGADQSNRISDDDLAPATYVGIAVDSGPEMGRHALTAVPFARRAATASALLSGAVVDASELRIDGQTVIDESGTFSGSVEGAYGDADVDAYLAATDLDLHSGTTLGGSEIATVAGSDAAYAAIDHDHDDDYAAIVHEHDATYAQLDHDHDADYAALVHEHDATYAQLDHDHDTDYAALVHEHDATYAQLDHDHDADYAALLHDHDTDYAALVHDHDADYAALVHDHDADYAALVHDHDDDYAALVHDHDDDYAALVHDHDSDYLALGGGELSGPLSIDSSSTGGGPLFLVGTDLSESDPSSYLFLQDADNDLIADGQNGCTTNWGIKADQDGSFALHQSCIGDRLTISYDGDVAVRGALTVGGPASLDLLRDHTGCSPSRAGTIRWTGSAFEGCDGAGWRTLDTTPSELSGLVVYYDAAEDTSYPGSGTTWYDLSGSEVDGTFVGGTSFGSYGGVPSLVFGGANNPSGVQFPNSVLNANAFTAIYWVWSELTTSNTNEGGLYVNRNDNDPNQAGWVWFGKWSTDYQYWRVLNASCCQDLSVTNWSTYIPASEWRMVHFAYQPSVANAWKWGVNGSNVQVSTLSAFWGSQSESTSTIGYGHSGSGSYWKGGISSVRFYDRVLSDVEIAAEYERLRARYGK